MLQVLAERNFPVTELIPVASEKSVGKKVLFKGKEYEVVSFQTALDKKPNVAIFSAGGSTSKELAPKFAEVGCTVIDNSSAWRMEPGVPLVVPEVNASVLTATDKIIANPNCSTIQMVVVLKPLHDKYKIKRVVVSTYQSVTGTGKKAVDQMMRERKNAVGKMLMEEKVLPFGEDLGGAGEMAYAYQIDMNALPHIDVFLDNGYTKEEMKLVHETKKIMDDDSIRVTATTVRIPTIGGHSESVNIEFERDFDVDDVRTLLAASPGVVVVDDVKNLKYPMPIHAHDKDDTFVGRIRRDESQPNTLNCWIVSDNLRKGAATNAVQIAEYLLEKNLL